MDPLAFLYISLGVGFLVLVIFLSVTLLYLIQILRDVNKITDSVKDTADRINDYVVQPFAIINQVVEHIRPVIEAVQKKREDMEGAIHEKLHSSAERFKKRSKHREDEE